MRLGNVARYDKFILRPYIALSNNAHVNFSHHAKCVQTRLPMGALNLKDIKRFIKSYKIVGA